MIECYDLQFMYGALISIWQIMHTFVTYPAISKEEEGEKKNKEKKNITAHYLPLCI